MASSAMYIGEPPGRDDLSADFYKFWGALISNLVTKT